MEHDVLFLTLLVFLLLLWNALLTFGYLTLSARLNSLANACQMMLELIRRLTRLRPEYVPDDDEEEAR